MNKETKNEYNFERCLGILNLFLLCATTVGFFVQINISIKTMKDAKRPWVGVKTESLDSNSIKAGEKIQFRILETNYGEAPAINVQECGGAHIATMKDIEDGTIMKNALAENYCSTSYRHVLMPNETLDHLRATVEAGEVTNSNLDAWSSPGFVDT